MKNSRVRLISVLAFTTIAVCALNSARAEVLCVKTSVGVKGSKVALGKSFAAKASACPHGYSELVDTAVFQGPPGTNGTNGTNGADGSAGVYGNGGSGALTISSSTSLTDAQVQYTDFTINAGKTLTVPSGTVIRCTGNFSNQGVIIVSSFAGGGSINIPSAGVSMLSISSAAHGISSCSAAHGEYGPSSGAVKGGLTGCGISTSAQASAIVRPGAVGGGGGGGSPGSMGGSGGGTLTVLCKGTITNTGSILAIGSDGSVGSGGGGGGVVILASAQSISHTGDISVYAGSGGAANSSSGAGGGGGGGLIHFIAPAVTGSGTKTVVGGGAGSNTATVTSNPRSGGGGGGDGAGAGGAGSDVSSGNVSSGATKGADGLTITTLADPAALF
jgi:hypothetical protein